MLPATIKPTYTTVGKPTGTVTLKTGTTKAFTFGENSKFQLPPCARTATGRCLKSKLPSFLLSLAAGLSKNVKIWFFLNSY